MQKVRNVKILGIILAALAAMLFVVFTSVEALQHLWVVLDIAAVSYGAIYYVALTHTDDPADDQVKLRFYTLASLALVVFGAPALCFIGHLTDGVRLALQIGAVLWGVVGVTIFGSYLHHHTPPAVEGV